MEDGGHVSSRIWVVSGYPQSLFARRRRIVPRSYRRNIRRSNATAVVHTIRRDECLTTHLVDETVIIYVRGRYFEGVWTVKTFSQV